MLAFVLLVLAQAALGLPLAALVLALGGILTVTAVVSGADYVLVWSRLARQPARGNVT
jgi:hypothetical protein